MTLSPRDLRLLLILAKVVGREIQKTDDLRRRELLADTEEDPDEAMTPGESRAVHVRDADGNRVKVGTVRVDKTPLKVTVDDPDAFTAWVREHAPDEIVPAVRSSFQARVVEMVKQHGGWPHPETGELVEVPGVKRELGDPKIVATPTAGALEALAGAYQRGALPQWRDFLDAIGPKASGD